MRRSMVDQPRDLELRNVALAMVRERGATSITRLAQLTGETNHIATRILRALVRTGELVVGARGATRSFLPGPNMEAFTDAG